MADNRSLKVVEIFRVAPPPESHSPASLPLTFFDLRWLRFPPVQRLFFYEAPTTPFDATVSNLKTSLSVVLQHYLPLAGNLVWPHDSHGPVVESVEGDAVLLTVAESDADFYALTGDGFREAMEYHPLVPELPASDERAAVIALQVTSFPNVGFCIGITSHHAILDGRTSTSFVKSWAHVCKMNIAGESEAYFPATEPIPFYDRTIIEDPVGLEAIYLRDWLAKGGPNNRSLKFWSTKTPPDAVRGTFKLNPQNIQKLKKWVLGHREQNQPPIHISTFTVATAYTWVCAALADGLTVDDGKMAFGMSVDAGPRLDPPLPMNYFGNCVVARKAVLERTKLVGENGVVAAVEAISEAIRSLEDGALRGAETWVSTKKGAGSSRKLLTIAGSPRFEVYGVDFGWGKPKKVDMVSIDGTGAVCLSDSTDGEGVELGWVATRTVMESFAANFSKGFQQL